MNDKSFLFTRDVDLIKYLPPFIAEYKDIKNIMHTEDPEFRFLLERLERIKNNQFIDDCDEKGIERFEKLLKIKPQKNDTLESRKLRISVKWNDIQPYTWKMFLKKMHSLYGDKFVVQEDFKHYKLSIITHFEAYGQLKEVEQIIFDIMPANIDTNIKNTLNYSIKTNVNIWSGIFPCERFILTEALKENLNISCNMSVATINNSSYSITITE